MITSVVAGTAVADTGIDEADPADEVFVDESGDAVLVYDEDSAGESAEAEFGVDVAESVVYALVTDDIEEDISAGFSMELDDDEIESSGSLTADRPTEISDFSMDVTGEQSQDVNEFDADLDMVIDTAGTPEAAFVQSAGTSGEMVTSADEFATHGEFSATHAISDNGPDTGLDLEIVESDGSYTIDVSQQDELAAFEIDQWETEESAQASLEDEFGEIGEELGGDVTVTIHDHEFEETGSDAFGTTGYLDVEYTIELENVKDGVEQLLTEELTTDPELDLDQSEAEQLAADIVAAELDTFELSFQESGNTINGDWDVAFSEFDSTVLAVLDLIESTDEMDEAFADEFDEYAEMYEAQAAADLTQTAEWDVSFEQESTTEAVLSATFTSDTENWEAYTAELEDRGIDSPEFTLDAHAETVGDEIEFDMSLDVSQEDFLQTAMSSMIADLQNDPTVDDEALEFVSAVEEADLELAKFDLEIDDGMVTMEAGATFDDITAFEGQLGDAFHGLSVEHIYGTSEEGYIHVNGMVDEDASESDVRDHSAVDDSTVVHTSGEWDEEHPRLDMEQVSNYLDVEMAETESETESDDGLPGFGVATALVALLSTLVWARYTNYSSS
ncbi:PGF-CTERM sorting domain-containing protein [Natrialbaceae archaeon A-arb3/5]